MKDPKQFRERFKKWKEGTPIEEIYDNGRPTEYIEYMKRLAQPMAKNWEISEKEAYVHLLNDDSYDYYGWWKDGGKNIDPKTMEAAKPPLLPNDDGHFPDTYKTAKHPTFSNQSKYSGVVHPKYNPLGIHGGAWLGDTYLKGPMYLPGYSGGKDDKDSDYNQRPITTGGAGYIPNNYGQDVIDYIRSRLYEGLSPIGSYKNPIKKVCEALSGKKRISPVDEEFDYYVNNKGHHPSLNDDLFATYLGIPKENRRQYSSDLHIRKSKYKPEEDADNKNKQYYALPLEKITETHKKHQIMDISPIDAMYLITAYENYPMGEYHPAGVLSDLGLGKHVIKRDMDSKGEYIAYKDTYDLNPYKGNSKIKDIPLLGNIEDLSFGIGKPVNIYDRIYLDDYYGVPRTGSFYLPEVEITVPKKYARGKDDGDSDVYFNLKDIERLGEGRLFDYYDLYTTLYLPYKDNYLAETVDWINRLFDLPNRTYVYAGLLPEILITPTKEDKQTLKNARILFKNRNLRNSVYNVLGSDIENSKLSMNEKINNFAILDKMAKHPRMVNNSFTKHIMHYPNGDNDRPFYFPLLNTMSNIHDYHDYVAELSHALLYKAPHMRNLNTYSIIPGDDEVIYSLGSREVNGVPTASGYGRPGHPEFNAHSIIEPAISNFIESGRNEEDFYNSLDNAIKRAKQNEDYYILSEGIGDRRFKIDNKGNIIWNYTFKRGKDSGIYIKPSKRGTFTAAAKKRGLSVLSFASKVLNNPSNYSKAMRKKALFAKNASKFKH